MMDIIWDDRYCLGGIDNTFEYLNVDYVTIHNTQETIIMNYS